MSLDKILMNLKPAACSMVSKIEKAPISGKALEKSLENLSGLEVKANSAKVQMTCAYNEFDKMKSTLKERLERLNLSTVKEGKRRFGKDGIASILECATDKESIAIINGDLDKLEDGKQIWTYDIVEKFKGKLQRGITNVFFSKSGVRYLADVADVLKNKSTLPEVIALEERMKKIGYSANFADNLETAKVITETYENMAAKGFKMPKDVMLMIPNKEGMMGCRPFATKENRYNVPILFNKDLKYVENKKFPLYDLGIKYNATNTDEGMVYHEIGHFLHETTRKETDEAVDIWNKLTNDGYDIELGREVGYYAMTGDKYNRGNEFVAEVFSGLMQGKQYSNRVMEIYGALGGPAVK